MFYLNDLEKEVLQYISKHLNENDLLHTLGVVDQVKYISKKINLSDKETEILVLAAYFHDYTKRDGSVKEHHLTSAVIAEKYLDEKGYSRAGDVAAIIKTHSFPIKCFHDRNIENPKPSTKLHLLLIKADMIAQLEASGQSLMFVKNLKKKMSFNENLTDIKLAVAEAEDYLKWVEEMLRK